LRSARGPSGHFGPDSQGVAARRFIAPIGDCGDRRATGKRAGLSASVAARRAAGRIPTGTIATLPTARRPGFLAALAAGTGGTLAVGATVFLLREFSGGPHIR